MNQTMPLHCFTDDLKLVEGLEGLIGSTGPQPPTPAAHALLLGPALDGLTLMPL